MKRIILILIIIFVCVAGAFYFWEKFQTKLEQEQFTIKETSGIKENGKIEISSSTNFINEERCNGLIRWKQSDSVFYCLKPTKDEILINSPKENEKIKSPLKIEGKAKGNWFFEAQFTAELYDANDNILGRTILKSKGNWMTENFVPFEGELKFSKPATSFGKLRFLSDNPSGIPEKQKIFEMPVQFEEIKLRKVLLYYYNTEKDRDEKGNIKCSRDGLVAIEREIPITQTPIQDTINLLLKGKENLTQEDISLGITTEYPLEGLKLKSTNLKPDGTLILEFDDPLNKTSGGACRAGILWFQIEATAKQFEGVKRVQFLPEYLFQP